MLRWTAAFMAFTILLAAPRAIAFSVEPPTWVEQVLDADIVAVVECTTAGAGVARYRVVESFKGPAAGESVTAEVPLSWPWGGYHSVALVGERFVCVGKRVPGRLHEPSVLPSSTPTRWRDFGPAYWTTHSRSTPVVPGTVTRSATPGDVEYPEFEDFRRHTRAVLTGSSADREAAILKARARKHLLADVGPETLAKVDEILRNVNAAKTLPEVVDALFALAADRAYRNTAHEAVNHGGRATLALVEAKGRPNPFEECCGLAGLRERIEAREAPPSPDDVTPGPGKEPAPEVRAEHLLALEHASLPPEEAYPLASYRMATFKGDRAAPLTRLLNARDPYVRVAAAVYLTFEDRDAGMAALRELCALPGDPGAWAAVTLARRGDRGAVLRALDVLKDAHTDPDHHDVLQGELLALLSNAAARAGSPAFRPPLPYPQDERAPITFDFGKLYDHCHAWWLTQGDRVVLQDPWLAELEKQKID